jgi:hypothetical protein
MRRPAGLIASRRRRERVASRAGFMRLGTMIFLLLIIGGAYLVYVYLPPWIAYRALEDQMAEQAREARILPNEEIAARVWAVVKEWEIPVSQDDIVITRTDNRLYIRAQWDITIRHFGLYEHRLHFEPAVDEMILPIDR